MKTPQILLEIDRDSNQIKFAKLLLHKSSYDDTSWAKEVLKNHEYEKREAAKMYFESYICQIVFTKQDGTTRYMNCTRRPEYMLKKGPSTTRKTIKENRDVLTVYDLDLKEFRSFHWDSLILATSNHHHVFWSKNG